MTREPFPNMRARRHPRAILLAWCWLALSGLALAWPAVVAVGKEFHSSPDSDAPLFRPGALDLLDYVWRAQGAISAEIGHVVVLFPLAIVSAVFPLAILLASIAGVRRREAMRTLGALLAFEIGALVVQAVAGWGAFALAALTSFGLARSLGERRAELCAAAVLALGALVVILASIVRDLASAVAVGFARDIIHSLRASLRALTSGTFSILWSWLWRTSIGWISIAAAALLASRIGGKSGLFLIALALAHQSALAWKVAWRASWLAASLRSLHAADDATLSDR